MNVDLAGLWDLVAKGGFVGGLALGILAFYRRWLVPGWLYERERKRADRMQEAVWRLAGVSEAITAKLAAVDGNE